MCLHQLCKYTFKYIYKPSPSIANTVYSFRTTDDIVAWEHNVVVLNTYETGQVQICKQTNIVFIESDVVYVFVKEWHMSIAV